MSRTTEKVAEIPSIRSIGYYQKRRQAVERLEGGDLPNAVRFMNEAILL